MNRYAYFNMALVGLFLLTVIGCGGSAPNTPKETNTDTTIEQGENTSDEPSDDSASEPEPEPEPKPEPEPEPDPDEPCTSVFYEDSDGDGYGSSHSQIACEMPEGYSTQSGDCGPTDPTIYPGANELCDNKDNDCDLDVDEGFNLGNACNVGQGVCANSGEIVCTSPTESGCSASEGNPTGIDNDCNGIDEDCDGVADDGYVVIPTFCGEGACSSTGTLVCTAGTPVDTCVDGNPTAETCDGIDNDCDGETDEDCGPEECEPDTFCITTTLLEAGTISEHYEQTLTVQNGSGVGYTWKVVDGNMPGGLELDGNNVTPTWGIFHLTGYVDINAPTLSTNNMTEISGIAASRLNRDLGVIWTIDDRGNPANLFAIDESGELLQKYTISNASNYDWEDIAIGPGPNPGKEYLYIGDFGDNNSSRNSYKIVRIEEPVVPNTRQNVISIQGESFYFRYPDGSHNCESMLIDWDTSIIYLIQKTGGIGNVYKFPSTLNTSWDATHPVTLIHIGGSGMPAGSITAAASSRDSERILVRQYSKIWEYARPYGGTFDDIFNQTRTPIDEGDAKNQQYEAICYSSDGTDIYTITEKNNRTDVPIYKSEGSPIPPNTTISGTPTIAGTYTFTIQVKDSAGNSTTRELTITIR